MTKRIVTILGSTGSIGQSSCDLLHFHAADFSVRALVGNQNVALLAEQAIMLGAEYAVTADESLFDDLKKALLNTNIIAMAGWRAVLEAASMPCDITIAAIVGMRGLEPALIAAQKPAGHILAMANKEPLVAAWGLFQKALQESGTILLPVDSEHNAIHQVFFEDQRAQIDHITLTASGGAFRDWSLDAMKNATPEQAVAHPNWSMGAKISVDSASLFNKGLEVIEAARLFGLHADQIKVLVHPQSLIHGMVHYSDGSILAQMGAPDMRTPIANVLAWPNRMATSGRKLDLESLSRLDFYLPDPVRFPALPLAYECLRKDQGETLIYNAANEIAVAAFLNHRIGFLDIMNVVQNMLDQIDTRQYGMQSLSDILSFDQSVRRLATDFIHKA